MATAIQPLISSAPQIREARLEDYAQITALVARSGLYTKGREQWEHLWVHNPVYKKLNGWAIGWVAENANQEIIGYVANLPLCVEFKGRELLTSCVSSIVVDSSHRGHGYGNSLVQCLLNHKRTELVVGTTANAVSARLLQSCGFSRVPVGDWGHASFWITNYQGFVASVLSKRGWPRALSYPAAAALRLRDTFRHRDPWMRRNHCELLTCPSFDERFDKFWTELKRTHPERLLTNRSREVLQWHFKYPLEQGRVWIIAVGDDSRLLAYAIFRRRDVPEHGLKRMQLVDFQTIDGDVQVLTTMLAWALVRCRKKGIHMLEAFGFCPEKQAVIDAFAPHRRELPSWWYFYKPSNAALGQELQTPAVWDPTHLDGDTSL